MRPAPILIPAFAAAIAAASLGTSAAPAIAAAPAAAARPAGPVLSPANGGVVRSHRIRIRVRAGDLPGALRVRLNGVAVGDDFGPARSGVRMLITSVSHGLRRGRNVLRVTVLRSGRPPRRSTIRFTVRTRRHLTGAGRDRRVAIGATTAMTGRALAPRRGSRVPARWRVVSGPGVRRTRAAQAGTARRTLANGLPLAALRGPVLASPAGLGASFRPLVPGRYTLRLTTGRGAARASDEVHLTAVPPTPLVPVDTMPAKTGDRRGIRVGATTYLLRDAQGVPGGTATPTLQVVVLDRETLGPISNKAYGGIAKAERDLNALDDDSQLVIVSLQPGTPGIGRGDFAGLASVLASIGFSTAQLPTLAGSLSGIGVPRMEPGEADVSVAPLGLTDDSRAATYGRMEGYLSPDQYLNYGFIPSERVPFSYAAPDSPCGPGTACAGSVGFRVLVQNRKTLAPAARGGNGIVYQTGRPDLTSAQQTAEAQSMARSLATVEEGDLVIVQAVSTRGGDGYLPPVGEIDRAAMTALSRAIAGFGGTRNAVNRIARTTGPVASGGSTYTLVGWQGAAEGEAAEVAAGVEGAGAAPVLSGVLRPDRESRFRPAEVSEVAKAGSAPSALASLVLQEPADDWPLSDGGHARAIAWIGSRQPRLGSDPRSAYWTQSFTEADTNALMASITQMGYPGADAGFGSQEFVDARRQLVLELGWVGNVRSYFGKLQRPFSDGQLSQWVTAQTVADKVLEAAEDPDDEVTLEWIEFTAELLELLGPATEEVSGVLGGLLDLGMWAYSSTKSGGPGDGEMLVHANALGRALVDRAEQAKATMDRMGDVIVSDYAKLSVVGRYATCVAADGCPAGLRYLSLNQRDMARNSAQVSRGVERLAFQKLLPLGFNAMALTRVGSGTDWPRSHEPDVKDYRCTLYAPWRDYPADASASLLQDLDPTGRANLYDTFVLSRPPGAGTQHGTPPSEELLQRMFAPVPRTNDLRAGGLGMEPSAFMAAAPHRTWYSREEQEMINCSWAG